MARSLQGQVRDPAWVLARQWQLGEFQGGDAGSPVQATFTVTSRSLGTYRPGPTGNAAVPLDPSLPLEAHVEREPVALALRGAVQLGLYFEALARRDGATDADIQQFRTAFPIPSQDANDLPDIVTSQFRALVASRVTDGNLLYTAIAAGTTLPPAAAHFGQALQDFAHYRRQLYTEPSHDSAWNTRHLEYEFAVASEGSGDTVTLEASDFRGDRLEWYSFSLSTASLHGGNPATISLIPYNLLPNHVTFRGMPAPRWWTFEDSRTDFGQLDTDQVDLAKMLVMEFTLVYSNDWFEIPVQVNIGTLSRIDALVVTDTFGQRTLIRPTEAQVPPGQRPWSMFKIGGTQGRTDYLVVPPTLDGSIDGPVLEEVLFLRDDMAAIAWGVEKKIPGTLDAALDGHEVWRLRLAGGTPPPPRQQTPGGPEIYYLLEATVPDYWSPLVPVKTPSGVPYFRRGVIKRLSDTGLQPPYGTILEPGRPFFVTDQAVPRAGASVIRYFRRARWNGTVWVWLARRTRPGTGPGWSGLAYDLVEKMGQVPPEIRP